jgi:hypothetical protein
VLEPLAWEDVALAVTTAAAGGGRGGADILAIGGIKSSSINSSQSIRASFWRCTDLFFLLIA